jgi:DNA-directed RNA polymerase specialized sigma24 family protein
MSSSQASFATTHWTIIATARDGDAAAARAALAELCRTYWYPLYAFIRRKGHAADEAQDLTQEFFARLLERDFLGAVDRSKGKFRSFLLAACQHFLANEHDRANAQKRGGGRFHYSLELHDAEALYTREPIHMLTPEKLFERRWALTLLNDVLLRLKAEFDQAQKGPLFDRLKTFLTQPADSAPYRDLAAELQMSEGALRVAVHRLRQRYRELLEATIAQTVETPEQVQEEIRSLFAALAS